MGMRQCHVYFFIINKKYIIDPLVVFQLDLSQILSLN